MVLASESYNITSPEHKPNLSRQMQYRRENIKLSLYLQPNTLLNISYIITKLNVMSHHAIVSCVPNMIIETLQTAKY